MLEGDAAPTKSTLEMIRRNVELESRLIDDLLDVARIGRGTLRLAPEILDAHDSIRRAVAICREETDAAGLAIDLDLAAASHHVRADPVRLLQIAWNLIRNAAKFTPAGGKLTIRTSNLPGVAGGTATSVSLPSNSGTPVSGSSRHCWGPFSSRSSRGPPSCAAVMVGSAWASRSVGRSPRPTAVS